MSAVPEPVAGQAAEPVIQRDIVVIGASAGGVEALGELVGSLPPELPAAIFVVLHMAPTGYSVLPEILARSGRMPATSALDGERYERGHIYVVPPDWHMLVGDGEIQLTRGPRENGHRPAIDPLFRSAARAHGSRCIGVILSGALDDGTAGLRVLKGEGGVALVQEPADALYPGMPTSALANVDVDGVAPAAALADAIARALDEQIAIGHPGHGMQTDPVSNPGPPDLVELPPDENEIRAAGESTGFTCPECGGVLFEHVDGALIRFGCQVGHAYSPISLLNAQSEALEGALWAALRSLEERGDVLRRMARRATYEPTVRRLDQRAAAAEQEALVIRRVATQIGSAAAVDDLGDPGEVSSE